MSRIEDVAELETVLQALHQAGGNLAHDLGFNHPRLGRSHGLRHRKGAAGLAAAMPASMAFGGRAPPKSIFYFLVSAFAAPGFGLASGLGPVPADARTFFLSVLGFLASRLLLF